MLVRGSRRAASASLQSVGRRFSTTGRFHSLSKFSDAVLEKPFRRSFLSNTDSILPSENKVSADLLYPRLTSTRILTVASSLASHPSHISEVEAYCPKKHELSVSISGMMNSYLADPQVDYRKIFLLTRIVNELFSQDEVYWNKVRDFI